MIFFGRRDVHELDELYEFNELEIWKERFFNTDIFTEKEEMSTN